MIKRNSFVSKYVNVPTNSISKRSATNRTICTCKEYVEQRKVSDMPSINSKTNNFQNRRTEFIIKVNLNKEECISMTPPLS
jgi:hypothetical protein